MKKRVTVATHDEKFHADEVLSVSILKMIYPNLRVIRTRDEKKLKKADIRVDVGGNYNPKTNDYDHHQNSFNLRRKNGVLYSSCGLIWKHFGRKLVNSREAWEYIDENLVEFIDAGDNGVAFSNGKVSIYSIEEVIDSFNPIWEERKRENFYFFKAVKYFSTILNNEIKKANLVKKEEQILKSHLQNNKKEYVLLPRPEPESLLIKNKKIKFSIYPSKNGWVSCAVRVKLKSFERRAYFPKSWAGLRDEEFEKISGVKGAVFCHKNLFIVVSKTKEGAIKLTELALKQK